MSIHVEKNNPAMQLYVRLGFTVAEDKGVYDLMECPAPAHGAAVAASGKYVDCRTGRIVSNFVILGLRDGA